MAEEHDPFASIIDLCRYSFSQEDLLAHSKFAREEEDTLAGDGVGKSTAEEGSGGARMEMNGSDEFFAVCADCEAKHDLGFPGERKRSPFEVVYGGGGKSTAEEGSGGSRMEMNGSDDGGERDSGEFFAVCADCEAKQDLGFPGDRKRSAFEVVYDNKVRVSELPEPPAKKSRVLGPKSPNLKGGRVSPLVHCTEKMGTDSEDNITQVMVFRSGVKVEIVSPLRYVAPEISQCSERLGSDGGNEDQVEVRRENLAKKKLEFGADMEEIRAEDNTDGSAKPKHTQNQGDGTSRDIKRQGKRELPRSLLGQVWGATADGGEGAGNGVSGSGTRKYGLNEATVDVGEGAGNGVSGSGSRESGLNEATVEVSGNGKSMAEADETMKHIFYVLRILAFEKHCDGDDGEIDIFETAKSRGMKFPVSRFLLGRMASSFDQA